MYARVGRQLALHKLCFSSVYIFCPGLIAATAAAAAAAAAAVIKKGMTSNEK